MFRTSAFYLLTAGAFAALTIPRMAQAGMFLDGVTYAAIARNLAEGMGSFWSPFYTFTVYPSFHEQPPLGLVLQSGAFRLFGDHLAVERVYCLLLGGLTGALIVAIWCQTVREKEHGWLPLVFWLLPAGVTWSIVNNMLEVTQGVFTTFAVLAFVCSLRGTVSWVWALAAGLSVSGAVLVKGPVGLFPLAAPVLVAVLLPKHRTRAMRSGLAMAAAVALVAVAVFMPEDSRQSLETYWAQRVAPSFTGVRGGGGRLNLMARYLGEGVVLRMAGLAVLAWLVGRRRPSPSGDAGDGDGRDSGGSSSSVGPSPSTSAWTPFFVWLALAGSLPIAASAKIAGHYLVPSIPIYALAAASLSLPAIRPVLRRWRERPALMGTVGTIGLLLLSSAIALPPLVGPFEPRDVAWIREYQSLSPALPRGVIVGTCEGAAQEWSLQAYMQRFSTVSLDAAGDQSWPFYLQLKDRECFVPASCRLSVDTARLALYECRQPAGE